MDPQHKRELREQKRITKRKGNQRLRRQWKHVLQLSPEDVPFIQPDYGQYRSQDYNGMDQDATRKRPLPRPAETPPEPEQA